MSKIKQPVKRSNRVLDWQFPDEEAWTEAQTSAPAPRGSQARSWRLTEQQVAIVLMILVNVAYWLWSEAKGGEERRKTVRQQLTTQESPASSAEPNSPLSAPSARQSKQTTLLPPALEIEDRSHDAASSTQQEPICFWSHIACNTSP